MQRNAATKAEGLVHGAGINSMAEVAQAVSKLMQLKLKVRHKDKRQWLAVLEVW